MFALLESVWNLLQYTAWSWHNSTVRSAYCYRPSSVQGLSVTVCQSVCHLVRSAETAVAIEMSFASTTLVGPGKHLLHIADRFGRILYCVHSTQYSLFVLLLYDRWLSSICQSNCRVISTLKWTRSGQTGIQYFTCNRFFLPKDTATAVGPHAYTCLYTRQCSRLQFVVWFWNTFGKCNLFPWVDTFQASSGSQRDVI